MYYYNITPHIFCIKNFYAYIMAICICKYKFFNLFQRVVVHESRKKKIQASAGNALKKCLKILITSNGK